MFYSVLFVFAITHAPQAEVHALVQLLTIVDVAAGTWVPPSRRPWLQRRSQGEGQGKNVQLLLLSFTSTTWTIRLSPIFLLSPVDLSLNLAPPRIGLGSWEVVSSKYIWLGLYPISYFFLNAPYILGIVYGCSKFIMILVIEPCLDLDLDSDS